MYQNKTFLAIIPARGGSKRLPRKNVLDLHGKPLMGWSIEAGLKSKYIDKVIVTSDDVEILDIAKDAMVEVIRRPTELASDTSTTFDAIKHTINSIEKYNYIVLLQPTSPLRTAKHIDEAIELLVNKKADSVVSVCKTDHSPMWSNILPSDGSMTNFVKDDIRNMRSQDLGIFYRLNGAIYICNTNKFLDEKSFFLKDNAFAYKMDRDVSIDIDRAIDLKIAKALF